MRQRSQQPVAFRSVCVSDVRTSLAWLASDLVTPTYTTKNQSAPLRRDVQARRGGGSGGSARIDSVESDRGTSQRSVSIGNLSICTSVITADEREFQKSTSPRHFSISTTLTKRPDVCFLSDSVISPLRCSRSHPEDSQHLRCSEGRCLFTWSSAASDSTAHIVNSAWAAWAT